jgi:hypothetical protein
MIIEINDELIYNFNSFRKQNGDEEITDPEELEDVLSELIEETCEEDIEDL